MPDVRGRTAEQRAAARRRLRQAAADRAVDGHMSLVCRDAWTLDANTTPAGIAGQHARCRAEDPQAGGYGCLCPCHDEQVS